MSKKTRLLIVDDSVVFRTCLRSCVNTLADVEVVGAAQNGRDAIVKIKSLKPDLVTLDMEMPHLNGIEVLERLQKEAPNVCVLVLSSASETDAERTMQALKAGAFDFLIKPDPSNKNQKEILLSMLKEQISVARSVASVVRQATGVSRSNKRQTTKAIHTRIAPKARKPDIVAIGSSTGGPMALQKVLTNIPKNFSVPIIVTQHMPKLFLASLAKRMNTDSKLECKLIEDGMPLESGCIYVAPGEIHTEVEHVGAKLHAKLVDGPKVHHCKPAVDITFHSLVKLAPRVNTLAIVLTGMGADGAAGAKALADKHAYVIAQDEASSVVWGMPGETVRLGAAHEVLPLNEITAAIIKRCEVG